MNIILGAGLAGLSAGHTLEAGGEKVVIVEKGASPGGLAGTIRRNDFLFDIGGHRFITKIPKIERLVFELLKDDLLTVSRKSRIYMMGKFIDYPLKPLNAIFGLGFPLTFKILADYMTKTAGNGTGEQSLVSLEDWVVQRFGRTMFELYFKEYSEKVWGLDCNRISMEWVERRIDGLSLAKALKNAFVKSSGENIDTLADRFLYPTGGIGRIAERLAAKISESGDVLTNTEVASVYHDGFRIKSVSAKNRGTIIDLDGDEFISTIPLTQLVRALSPAPPKEVLDAVGKLRYRDLVIVCVMVDREKVTDLTWIYLPERSMPIGRIHEPKNWSAAMAPEAQTHLVAEYFAAQNDDIWSMPDDALSRLTVDSMESLGFINKKDVFDSCVVRVRHAYPILEVGYRKYYDTVIDYLGKFKNLHLTGRTGGFRYLNMDHAMESGINTAEEILDNTIVPSYEAVVR